MRLLKSEQGVHEYEFDRKKLEIHEILGMLAGYPGIEEVEIRKAPIEDVIAELYRSWKAGADRL